MVDTAIRCSDEQAQLLDTAHQFCRDHAPPAQVRDWLEDPVGPMQALWPKVAELGWTAITIPEEHGGIGLGPGELVAVLEPMGEHLLTLPLLDHALAAEALVQAGTPALQAHWLPRMAAGELVTPALYGPGADLVPDGQGLTMTRDGADLVLQGQRTQVADLPAAAGILCLGQMDHAPALLLVTAEQLANVAATQDTCMDAGRRAWTVDLSGVRVPAGQLLRTEATPAALAAMERLALLGNAADACGAIEGALRIIVDYLNTRVQFGRRIGSFQALKHPAVDILTGLDAARSHLYHAATLAGGSMSGGGADTACEVAIRMAKAQAEETLLFAGDRAVQFHGGYGFTWECPAGQYLRRAYWHQSQWGDARLQRKRLAQLLLDGAG